MKKSNEMKSLMISTKQAEGLIPIIEKSITEKSQILNEKLQPFKEQEQAYLKEKFQIENLQTELNSDKVLLENLVRTLNRDKKEIRVMRTTSHTDIKKHVGQRKDNIRWADEFANMMKAEQRLLSFDELWSGFIKRFPQKNNDSDVKRKFNQMKSNLLARQNKVLFRAVNGIENKLGIDFLSYKDCWGLASWFNVSGDELKPNPKYIKTLMYAHAGS